MIMNIANKAIITAKRSDKKGPVTNAKGSISKKKNVYVQTLLIFAEMKLFIN